MLPAGPRSVPQSLKPDRQSTSARGPSGSRRPGIGLGGQKICCPSVIGPWGEWPECPPPPGTATARPYHPISLRMQYIIIYHPKMSEVRSGQKDEDVRRIYGSNKNRVTGRIVVEENIIASAIRMDYGKTNQIGIC